MRTTSLLQVFVVILLFFPSLTWAQSSDFKTDSLQIMQFFNQINTQAKVDANLLEKAKEISRKDPKLLHLFNIHFVYVYIRKGQLQKADSIVNVNIQHYSDKDSLSSSLANFYNLKGIIKLYKGEQEEATQQMTYALRIYEHNNMLKEASKLKINMANIFITRKAHKQAYQYATEAVKDFKIIKDSTHLPLALGMAAISSFKLNKWQDTKNYAEEGLKISKIKNNERGLCIAYYALSELYFQNKAYDKSFAYSTKSLNLAQKTRDYTLVLGNRALLLQYYLELKKYDSAIIQSNEALDLAKKMNNNDILYSLYKNTAKVNHALGKEKLAFEQMQKAEELYTKKVNQSNQKTINDLLIKYEIEKKNNQILRQEKNLAQQRAWIVVLAALALVALLIGFGIRKNAQQKRKLLEQKMKIEIAEAHTEGEEHERHRIAGELHDGTASNLVALRFMLPKNNTQALNLLDNTHKEIRTIAHRLAPINFEHTSLAQEIQSFCQMCQSEQTEIAFIPNIKYLNLSHSNQQALYRIAQELIQNALKHAEATQVSVQLMATANICKLTVEDNGKGFDIAAIEQQGLSSLKRRVASIGGTMAVDSQPHKGTSIFVEVK